MKKYVNGHLVEMPAKEAQARQAEQAKNAQPPTPAELDALADKVSEAVIAQNRQWAALGMVMADLVAAQFNMTQAEARQEVRTRFRSYYRALLEG